MRDLGSQTIGILVQHYISDLWFTHVCLNRVKHVAEETS